MTPEQINELERLEAAATPAPWAFEDLGSNELVVGVNREVCALPGMFTRKNDFEYIASTRNAIPSLIRDWQIMHIALRQLAEMYGSVECSYYREFARTALEKLNNGH